MQNRPAAAGFLFSVLSTILFMWVRCPVRTEKRKKRLARYRDGIYDGSSYI